MSRDSKTPTTPNAHPLDSDQSSQDGFLKDIEALASDEPDQDARALEPLMIALPEVPPPSQLRQRLLAKLATTPRFERFASAVAELLDVDEAVARALLEQLDDRSRFEQALPGVELFWVEGGPRVADAVVGFVRIAAGVSFPEHEHLGEERVLILQGTHRDPERNRSFHPGELDVMPAGSSHYHEVPADGPDLLVLSVVQTGMCIGEQKFLPRRGSANQH